MSEWQPICYTDMNADERAKWLRRRTRFFPNSQCWEWILARTTAGYGRFTFETRGERVHMRAHRASWEVFRGEITPGLHVCHHCDNPPCINPDHLYLATALQNNGDKRDRHRAWFTVPPDVVKIIKTDPRSSIKLSRELGVSSSHIRMIRRGVVRANIRVTP